VPAKFVLKKGSSGKFRFNLLATNGQVIASSEAYESKAAAMRGIQSVQKNAAGAAVDDQTAGSAAPAKKTATAKKAAAKTSTAKKTSAAKSASTKTGSARKTAVKKSSAKKTARGSNGSKEGDHQYDTVELQLGTCHYGGLDEPATLMATREDGAGWISICEQHRDQAKQDGFVVNEDV
jgi:uncharacterized protein YegP (UPF0339 family)